MFYYDPSQRPDQPSASYGTVPGETQPRPAPITQGMQAIMPPPGPSQPFPPSTPPGHPGRAGARSTAIFVLICVIVLVFGAGLFAGWVFAASHPTGSGSTSSSPSSSASPVGNTPIATLSETQQEAVIARVEPAVVEIEGTTSQGEAIGSGVIIDSKGDIVTNAHVVQGVSSPQVVFSSGGTVTAQIVGTSQATDLAVLHIQPFAGMVAATLGDSSQLTVGQEVLAIGNPLGYTETATEGVVSGLNRSISESRDVTLTGMIQTSAPINPGNSGGALINLQGQVIGMPTLAALNTETNTPANGLGFAIPSNQIKTIAAQLLNS